MASLLHSMTEVHETFQVKRRKRWGSVKPGALWNLSFFIFSINQCSQIKYGTPDWVKWLPW